MTQKDKQALLRVRSQARLVQELRALVMQNAAEREFRPAFETPYLIAAVLLLAALAWLMRRKLT